jgi:hypothetical protein
LASKFGKRNQQKNSDKSMFCVSSSLNGPAGQGSEGGSKRKKPKRKKAKKKIISKEPGQEQEANLLIELDAKAKDSESDPFSDSDASGQELEGSGSSGEPHWSMLVAAE